MTTQYRCKNQQRLKLVENRTDLNGIDFLEVSSDQKILKVHFANDLPTSLGLNRNNVVITGGIRVRGATFDVAASGAAQIVIDGELRVESIAAANDVLTVQVNKPGDFSTYTLHLIDSPTNLQPPSGFDRQLAAVDFSFKVDCPSEFDCAPADECPLEKLPEPEINYLAKDYASFRRLMLDRLSVIAPGWDERNPADLGVALVELLAYMGDHLSYFQDAVATEAYLGTAHKRTSVRRHARLLDYLMHDGANARVWVCFEYNGNNSGKLQAGTQLLTRGAGGAPTLDAEAFRGLLPIEKPEVFETLHAVTLQKARNTIHFYTWQDHECCLPRGATHATVHKKPDEHTPELTLAVGDVLIFEEIKSPTTGKSADADPSHRHAVRLTRVDATVRDTLPTPLVDLIEIEWGTEDALPFPLCISTVIQGNQEIENVSVARGNVVLADHGVQVIALNPGGQYEALAAVPDTGSYRPKLRFGPMTQQGQGRDPDTHELVPIDPKASARAALRWELRDVQPWITLRDGSPQEWTPRRDLLSSDRFAKDFVVEVETDGSASLRFGDDVLGKKPTTKLTFTANYRVGNGSTGNVGADAITRVVTVTLDIARVWNPLPATGGTDPESMEQVKQFAPQAFRVQERAVTEADYAEVTQRRSDVQKAKATLRWTGSWYTAFVSVDRQGGLPVDARFEADLRAYLNRYRLAGYDLEINGPIFVPLNIVLIVCVKPGYFRSDVKQALLRTFSNTDVPGGQRGFFHPDHFTFGQPVYVSAIYEAAMAMAGVDSVQVEKFQRWGKAPHDEKTKGLLTPGEFEVIRLDNDPNFPENGKIDFVMHGGL